MSSSGGKRWLVSEEARSVRIPEADAVGSIGGIWSVDVMAGFSICGARTRSSAKVM